MELKVNSNFKVIEDTQLRDLNGGNAVCQWGMLGISTGASLLYGAAIGSVFPVAGNIVGALVGFGLGAVGNIGCSKKL